MPTGDAFELATAPGEAGSVVGATATTAGTGAGGGVAVSAGTMDSPGAGPQPFQQRRPRHDWLGDSDIGIARTRCHRARNGTWRGPCLRRRLVRRIALRPELSPGYQPSENPGKHQDKNRNPDAHTDAGAQAGRSGGSCGGR